MVRLKLSIIALGIILSLLLGSVYPAVASAFDSMSSMTMSGCLDMYCPAMAVGCIIVQDMPLYQEPQPENSFKTDPAILSLQVLPIHLVEPPKISL
ncbi:hypothetical protein HYR53_11050 [Candidatus Acetothermia bacterium]|nr:hypothetical protein [Candidatus Acetothermia bacterium]